MKVFPHQAPALAELQARAETYFAGIWREIPSLRTRFATLVAGSTGSGKSFITTHLAEIVGASILRTATPGWMPCGAHNRAVKETLALIACHIAAHDKTILVLDEIDKLYKPPTGSNGGGTSGGDTSWLSYIRGELYEIMDGRFPPGLNIDIEDGDHVPSVDKLSEKLRNSVFIVGVGTFQDFFDQTPKKTMGFGGGTEPILQIDAAEVATRLPRELSNRFHGSLIVLPDLEPDNYREIVSQTTKSLPVWLQPAFLAATKIRINDAITTKKGVRFVEEALLDALVATRGMVNDLEPPCI
jgi:hypothetical protein